MPHDYCRKSPNRTMAPLRDPAIAMQEEFNIATRQGTRAAFELFITRHPDSPQAAEARQLRDLATR